MSLSACGAWRVVDGHPKLGCIDETHKSYSKQEKY